MNQPTHSSKQLLKILIGAAWIDGHIQSQEREYLLKTAQQYNLANDPDIRPLLYQLRTVKPEECYRWLEEYFGGYPSQENYEQLIEAISALIYSDGDVANEEAKLLTQVQQYDPTNTSSFDKVLKTVQKLYQRYVTS